MEQLTPYAYLIVHWCQRECLPAHAMHGLAMDGKGQHTSSLAQPQDGRQHDRIGYDKHVEQMGPSALVS